MPPEAGKAFLRPLQNFRRCASSWLTSIAARAAFLEHLVHRRDLFGDFFAVPSLSQSSKAGRGQIVARVHVVLGHRRHALIHEFESRRHDAARDHVRHRARPPFRWSESSPRCSGRARGFGTSLTVTSVVIASIPSLPITTDKVDSRRVERFGSELDRLTLRGIASDSQHVVQRHAVFQAVHAARILRDVAADGAGDLAARVRSVVEAEGRRRLADRQIPHAALDRGGARQRIDLENLVEFRQRQRYAEAVGQRAAGQTRAGPAGNDRNAQPVADLESGGQLRFVLRNHHGHGRRLEGRQPVALVRRRILAAHQERGCGQHVRQRRGYFCPAGGTSCGLRGIISHCAH